MTTIREFTTTNPGPVHLSLKQKSGKVSIAVDATAYLARVTVSTDADDGPGAEAVEQAKISEIGQHLAVAVLVKGGSGGVMITGNNYSSINFSGGSGRVIINGVDVTDMVNGGTAGKSSTVTTHITLPLGSEVHMEAGTADVTIKGALRVLDYSGTSGTLAADEVGDCTVDLSSGTAQVRQVTKRLDVNLSSGEFTLTAYDGSDARLHASSGNLRLHASKSSSGRLNVGVSSGNATITGAGHLDVRKRCSSGNIRVN